MKGDPDMKKKAGFIKSYHRIKFIELVLLIIIEITYFCIVYSDRRLRTAVYANPVLFRLCCMMWLLLIFSLLFLCIDFFLLRRAANENCDLNRAAYLDTLTGIPNRNSVDILIGSHSGPDASGSICCAIFRIANITDINQASGHEAGNTLIRDFCAILQRISNPYGFVARNGGNDFLAVFDSCDRKRMDQFMNELNTSVNDYNDTHATLPILLDSASSVSSPDGSETLTDLIAETAHKIGTPD